MDRIPLVLDGTGAIQQLQSQDDLNIPLEQRFQFLQERFDQLVFFLAANGFEIPEDVIWQCK